MKFFILATTFLLSQEPLQTSGFSVNYEQVVQTRMDLASKMNEPNIKQRFEDVQSSYVNDIYASTVDESKHEAILYVKENTDTTDIISIMDFLKANASLSAILDFNLNCSSLNLTSEECEKDCDIYANLIVLIGLLEKNQTYKLLQYVGFYSYSGSPLVAMDNGNYDMCQYNYGTYCYTPAESGTSAIYQHGCCIPGNCTGEDAEKVVQQSTFCYQGFKDTYGYLVNITYGGDVGIYCKEIPRHFDAFSIIIILIFFIFLLFVCIASTYKQLIDKEEIHILFFRKESLDSADDTMDLSGDSSNNSSDKKQEGKTIYDNTINTFVSVFNIQDSWKNFMSTRKNKDLNFLDGIRWWSMCWVVFGHAFFFNLFIGLDNERTVFPYDSVKPARDDYNYDINDFYTTLALQGFFSVDSFFWLSGFLACWTILRLVPKMQKIRGGYGILFPVAYLFRYLRLGPMMIYVTLLNWKISDQIGEGPHIISRDVYESGCEDNWYKVFGLFANLYNLNVDETEGCMGHLWYIQCDFQMFLFLPIFVIIYHHLPRIGMLSTFCAFLTCIIIRIYYGYYYHFAANMIIPGIEPIHNGNQGNDSYFKPWTRMGPYWAGVLGMMLLQSTYSHIRLTKLQYWIISSAGAFVLCSLTFWPYGDVVDAPARRWGLYQNIWYFALSRPGWGVGLSLLAYAMRFGTKKPLTDGKTPDKQTDHYVIIGRDEMLSHQLNNNNNNNNEIDRHYNENKVATKDKIGSSVWENFMLSKELLSIEAYQPLAKLTYTMYLVHMLIYEWYIDCLETDVTYSVWEVLFLFCGILIVTFAISVILWLVMEKPMANMAGLLIKAIMGGGGGDKQQQNGKKGKLKKKRSHRMSQMSNENYKNGYERFVENSSENDNNAMKDNLLDNSNVMDNMVPIPPAYGVPGIENSNSLTGAGRGNRNGNISVSEGGGNNRGIYGTDVSIGIDKGNTSDTLKSRTGNESSIYE